MVAFYRSGSAGRCPDGVSGGPPTAGRRARCQPWRGAPVAARTHTQAGRGAGSLAAGEPPALLSWTHRDGRVSTNADTAAAASSAGGSAQATDPPLVTAPTRRPASRTRVALAVATVFVIASTLASIGITRARDREAVRAVPAEQCRSGRTERLIGDAVALGAVPIGLAEDAGAVWVLDHTNAAVARVDPETRRVVQTIPDVGNDPQAISARGGNVWVAVFGSRMVMMINAESNKVVDRIEVEPARSGRRERVRCLGRQQRRQHRSADRPQERKGRPRDPRRQRPGRVGPGRADALGGQCPQRHRHRAGHAQR